MNKRERMLAVFENKTPDCLPAGFWHHYQERNPAELAKRQLDFYKKTNMDFLKIMYEYMFSLPEKVQKPSDWYKIKPAGKNSPEYKKQIEVINRILDGTKEDVMSFTTMFNAMKMAAWCIGDAGIMIHAKEDPQALRHGLRVFAEVLEEWACGFLETGIDGIFYSAQFGEVGRFNKEEWNTLIKPFDLQVLSAIKAKGKFIILHLCGEPNYDFKVHIDRYGEYPRDMINWAIHANHYDLSRGIDYFSCPVMGGLDNRSLMLKGPIEEVDKAIDQLAMQYGKHGFILGADCSIQGDYNENLIAHAVEHAHNISLS